MRHSDFSLYLITDRHQTGDRPLLETVRRALEGGVRSVQLREKDLTTAELYRLGRDMRQLTAEFNAQLIINDRIDVAQAVGADGVHIGVSSLTVSIARKLLGPGMIIGYSAHATGEALAAEADGADFVTFGPLFPTPSKAAYGEPCGVKKLADTAAALRIPLIALGGINQDNAATAIAAAGGGIAVISAIMGAADPCAAAALLIKKIEEHGHRS